MATSTGMLAARFLPEGWNQSEGALLETKNFLKAGPWASGESSGLGMRLAAKSGLPRTYGPGNSAWMRGAFSLRPGGRL